jgi:hypothetical protein
MKLRLSINLLFYLVYLLGADSNSYFSIKKKTEVPSYKTTRVELVVSINVCHTTMLQIRDHRPIFNHFSASASQVKGSHFALEDTGIECTTPISRLYKQVYIYMWLLKAGGDDLKMN